MKSKVIYNVVQKLLLIASLLVLNSTCSRTTEVSKSRLVGEISMEYCQIEDEIIVELYHIVDNKEEITRCRSLYPWVAFTPKQIHLFDPSRGGAVYSVQSDSNGYFYIDNISQGRYNIAIRKNGDVVKQYVDIGLFNVEVNLNQVVGDTITLHNRIQIGGYIDYDYVFEENKIYFISEDLIISTGTYIEFKPGSIIEFRRGKNIDIHGNVRFYSGDLPVIFRAMDPSEEGRWGRILLSSNASIYSGSVENISLSGSLQGLVIQKSGVSVISSYFSKSQYGLYVISADYISVEKCVFEDIQNSTDGALFIDEYSNCNVSSSIFIHNSIGIGYKTHSYGTVENSFFANSSEAIRVSFSATPEIHNNEFTDNSIAIRNANGSSSSIQYNNFKGNTKAVSLEYITYTYPLNDQPTIHYNNFSDNLWALYMRPGIHGDGLNYDVPAQFNYYNTTNLDEIRSVIYDTENGLPELNRPFWSFLYLPIAFSSITTAGIK